MSKLIDALRHATKEETRPMGFGKAVSKAEAFPFVIIRAGAKSAAGETLEFCDAAIMLSEDGFDKESFSAFKKNFGEKPVGCVVSGLDDGLVKTLEKEGCDFAVFNAGDALASVNKTEALGKILIVPSDLDNGLLRAVSQLPQDAMLLTGQIEAGEKFTWQNMLNIKRIVGATSKPALIEAPASLTLEELKALWDNGLDGIVVSVSTKKDGEKLKALTEEIKKTNWSKKSSALGESVLFPKIPSKVEEEPEEE